MRITTMQVLGYSEDLEKAPEVEADLRPHSVGLTKKACHEIGMEMRRDGKVCFCMPNKDDPKKRDLMVP